MANGNESCYYAIGGVVVYVWFDNVDPFVSLESHDNRIKCQLTLE